MSESASALFSIADAGEFRFARFYIVCEEVPLGTPESPLIVCGLSDTLRECPNVAKTRNGMPATAWKKYVNFASKNLPPSVYSGTFLLSGLLIILLITQKMSMLIAAVPSYSHEARNPEGESRYKGYQKKHHNQYQEIWNKLRSYFLNRYMSDTASDKKYGAYRRCDISKAHIEN